MKLKNKIITALMALGLSLPAAVFAAADPGFTAGFTDGDGGSGGTGILETDEANNGPAPLADAENIPALLPESGNAPESLEIDNRTDRHPNWIAWFRPRISARTFSIAQPQQPLFNPHLQEDLHGIQARLEAILEENIQTALRNVGTANYRCERAFFRRNPVTTISTVIVILLWLYRNYVHEA